MPARLPAGHQAPARVAPARVTPRRVTFATAVATAQQAAGLTVGRRTKLRKQVLARTPVGAERLAAAGVMNRAGKGALAALLTAAGTHPRDPLLLIDAAALLIDAGKPNEALALLTRAQTLPQRKLRLFGISTLAILETNRSAALFRTGQYAAAAAAGRRALKKSAWLVEARENRGMALLCLNKDEEAACELRAAAKRPLEEDEERLTCSARAATPGDFAYAAAPQAGVWPAIGYPALANKAAGYVDYYSRLSAESSARSKKANDEFNRLTLKLQRPDPDRSPASKSRATDLYAEMLKVPVRPAFTTQLERAQALQTQINDLVTATNDEMRRIITTCAGSDACVHDRCNTLLVQNHTVWLARQTALEGTMRVWWRDLHAQMAGYAQAIGDPDPNARADDSDRRAGHRRVEADNRAAPCPGTARRPSSSRLASIRSPNRPSPMRRLRRTAARSLPVRRLSTS